MHSLSNFVYTSVAYEWHWQFWESMLSIPFPKQMNISLLEISFQWISLSLFCPTIDETIYTNVVAGVISGAVSSSIANPTDLLKVSITHTHTWVTATVVLSVWPSLRVYIFASLSGNSTTLSVLKIISCLPQVRMQSGTDQSYSQRTSVVRFFKQIYSEEGIRGLYRVRPLLA